MCPPVKKPPSFFPRRVSNTSRIGFLNSPKNAKTSGAVGCPCFIDPSLALRTAMIAGLKWLWCHSRSESTYALSLRSVGQRVAGMVLLVSQRYFRIALLSPSLKSPSAMNGTYPYGLIFKKSSPLVSPVIKSNTTSV